MSGSLIGGIVGATIGFFVGGPMGAAYGFSIGSAVGGMLSSGPTVDGPRLSDLKPQSSEYGRPIPIVYGTVALGGNVIWASPYIEEKNESGGGKGSPTVVNYSYFGNFAVAFCEGEASILRLWAGPEKRLIWDGTVLEGNGSVRLYKGSEDQLPDPLIESYLGVGNAPAYRGTCYVVFERFPLAKDGNSLPFITAEVMSGNHGGMCGTAYTLVGDGRRYDVPPVKLGNYGSLPHDPNPMYTSSGEHPTAMDNAGNLYVLVFSTTGGYKWYLKKVSTTTPIAESMLYLGDEFSSVFACSIAYNPVANILGIIQESSTNFTTVDCGTFTTSYSPLPLPKRDIIFSENEQRFCMLDAQPYYVDGQLSADSYGITGFRFDGKLVDCGPHGIAVSRLNSVYLNGSLLAPKAMEIYDPVRDRLLGVAGYLDYATGYYDFATGEVVTPTDLGMGGRINARYFPSIDRIIYNDADGGLVVMNPADCTSASMPDECKLFGGQLLYADGTNVNEAGGVLIPVPLPNIRNQIAVISTGDYNTSASGNDIFTFAVGVRGAGMTLASVVADLSDRARESRYDVSQLEADMVDGYSIARQTTVRNAIDALRPVYYFDAVESGGLIKYVKRGGAPVETIEADDLDARGEGEASGDPLLTTRQMEVELPRVVSVNYLLAATDYSPATKFAKRLVGASGNEVTLDLPLVLTDTKAQEVADVNLQVAWVQRLTYAFNLPRKYSHLEPTDHIVVKGNGMRVTKATRTPLGIVKCEAVADGSTFYTTNTTTTETPANQQTVSVPGTTFLELM